MKRKSEKSLEEAQLPKIILLYGDDGGDSHEPPVGIGGDPVYIDPPHDLPSDGTFSESALKVDTFSEDAFKVDAVRYYKYKFARKADEKPYFNLEAVRVLTEKGDARGSVNFVEHRVPRDRISKLRLWLGDAAGEPDIIVEGKNGGSISSAQPLDERQTSNPPKKNRNKRYYFPARDVRVVKWDIVDDSGTTLTDPATENGTLAAESDDQYYFYIFFAHE